MLQSVMYPISDKSKIFAIRLPQSLQYVICKVINRGDGLGSQVYHSRYPTEQKILDDR